MAKPKKGVIPPQLRKFLFKKGRGKTRRKRGTSRALRAIEKIRASRRALDRRIGRNPLRRHTSVRRLTRRRQANPGSPIRRVYAIITATKGKTRLRYDGRHFSRAHAARKFITLAVAEAKARQLLKQFPVLRHYQIHIRMAH